MNPRFTAIWELQLPEPHALADFERAWRAEQRATREARQSTRAERS